MKTASARDEGPLLAGRAGNSETGGASPVPWVGRAVISIAQDAKTKNSSVATRIKLVCRAGDRAKTPVPLHIAACGMNNSRVEIIESTQSFLEFNLRAKLYGHTRPPGPAAFQEPHILKTSFRQTSLIRHRLCSSSRDDTHWFCDRTARTLTRCESHFHHEGQLAGSSGSRPCENWSAWRIEFPSTEVATSDVLATFAPKR